MRRCPECGDSLVVHTPIDPDLVHRGRIASRWLVLACRLCGHVERRRFEDVGNVAPLARLIEEGRALSGVGAATG